MSFCGKLVPAITLAGLAALYTSPLSAQAPPNSVRVAPSSASAQAAYDAGAVQGARYGAQAGFQGAQFANPYYAYGPYGYYESPLGGFMNGTANVIGAQGQWMQSMQSADMTKEQVRQAKIDTRRKNFDEWQYERQNTPTFEDEREHFRMEDWRRSRNDPPLAEIWSGESLNFLLDQAQQAQARQGPGPTVPLDPGILQHINVNSGPSAGNAGLLKDGGRLRWPLSLRSAPYQADRQRIDELLPKTIKQASSGNQVDADALNDMIESVNNLNTQIKANIASLTPADYSSAKRYLRELNSGIQMLQNPNASKYISGQWSASGSTVAQLVTDMSSKGLRFAPATQADQAAYVALQRALAAYNTGYATLTAKR
jgi:hypothetical protein